eukprot:CAMPEP_0173386496 /NCGR_PEP_ID=MMETSP1356-20130122/9095_1 /TAXON_ID=77927 ORGANISM="Hemiselmis virescens, Strain PCC157" /NCGR_SAMPLE_ID=MMETSP1356 /ASSEMBLY_ACC=CAM_ASM_000847 /LENGTH=41 /DNA_ID= /DNA_START= /DNA_END= /DNA_ORIENTATION=
MRGLVSPENGSRSCEDWRLGSGSVCWVGDEALIVRGLVSPE